MVQYSETMTKTHTMSVRAKSGDTWLTAEWIYDAIMQHIDEDLVTSALPTLQNKYQGESDAERSARQERYKHSFTVFDSAFEDFTSNLVNEAKEYRDEQQRQAQAADQAQLASLEDRIDDIQPAT
jgi:hypothetical protein